MAEKQPAFVVVDRRKFTADGSIRDSYLNPTEERFAAPAPPPPTPVTHLRIEEAPIPYEVPAPAQEEHAPEAEAVAEETNVVSFPARSTVEADDFEEAPVLAEADLAASAYDVDSAAHALGEQPFVYPEVQGEHIEREPEAPRPPTAAETAAQNEAYQRSALEMDWLLRQANPGMKASGPVGFEHIVQTFYMSAIMAMGAGTEPGQKPRIDILGARQAIDMLSVLADKTRGNLDEKEQHLVDGVAFELRMMFLELTNAIAAQAQQVPGRR